MPSGPLLDCPLREWAWEEDPSRSTLVDGNMEAAGVAAWSVYAGATLTKETVTPYAGTRCLRITQAGVQSGAYQSLVLTAVGTPYRLIGHARSDGTAVWAVGDGGSVDRWVVGTSGVAWQDYDVKVISANTSLFLIKRAAGTWVEFDELQAIPSIARTKNVGLLGGSLQLGDGVTTATFPTQIGGMRPGMVLGGSQHLQLRGALASGTYTVAMTLLNTTPVANNAYLFDARDGGGVGYAIIGVGGLYSQSSGTTFLNGRPISAGVDTIPYGTMGTLVCSGMTLSSVNRIAFGTHNSVVTFWFNGRFYNISIYPGALTATQARAYHDRQMSLISMR